MSTYSFDVVSDFDRQELVNTLDQVRRDVVQRYDLKDSATEIDLDETSFTVTSASEMALVAVEDLHLNRYEVSRSPAAFGSIPAGLSTTRACFFAAALWLSASGV